MADQKVSDLPSLNGADVDAADLLYIIDSSAGSAGSKKITVGQYQLAPVSAGTANGVVYLNGSKVVATGSALVFDGSNFGVGTNSPGAKLNLVGDSLFQAASASNIFIFRGAATSPMNMALQANQGSGNAYWITAKTNSTLHIGGIGGSEPATGALVIDSSGNLGLGVTPGTWAASAKVLDFTFPAFGMDTSGAAFMTFNARNSSGSTWVYKSTDQAGKFTAGTAGEFIWETAVSGTAGNAISFTQAMTLDASGNLGVGAVSPGNRFYVNGPQAIPQIRATDGNVDIYVAYSFGTGASAVSYFGTNSNHPQVFLTNNTERARITSGGDLLVGTTTSAARMTVEGSALVAKFKRTSAGGIAQFQNGSDAGFGIDLLNVAGTSAGSIYWTATTTTYATSSDRRLKDNIVPAPSASAVIDAIEIVSHDWKSAPDEHVTFGVIAQDLALVAPQAVLQGDEGDEIEKTWGVDYSKLVPMLIKEIQSLRARVAALEQA